MTIRLSISAFAGTDRTLVAVGTARLAAMFVTVRAAAPRSRLTSVPGAVGGGAVVLGVGALLGAGAALGAACAGAGEAAAGAGALAVAAAPFPTVGRKSAKKLHQARSTDDGSAR